MCTTPADKARTKASVVAEVACLTLTAPPSERIADGQRLTIDTAGIIPSSGKAFRNLIIYERVADPVVDLAAVDGNGGEGARPLPRHREAGRRKFGVGPGDRRP